VGQGIQDGIRNGRRLIADHGFMIRIISGRGIVPASIMETMRKAEYKNFSYKTACAKVI
jgi:hypothetical protein